MKTDKDIAELMDYLYGEMSDQEKEVFEEKLANDPELQAELAELSGTQQILGQHTEVNPSEPLVISPVFHTQKSNDMLWRKWAGVAASLLVVLLAAAWWNLSIMVNNGAITISFNKAQQDKLLQEVTTAERNLTEQKAQINEHLQKRMAFWQDSLDRQFAMQKNQLDMISSQQSSILVGQNNNEFITKEELTLLLTSLNQEQSSNAALLVNASAASQKEYMENLITELAAYMDAKRESDLELINYALKEIQVQSNSKQEQTEMVLAKILEKWEND